MVRNILFGLLALLFLSVAGAAAAAPCNNYDWVPGEIRYDNAGTCLRAQVDSAGLVVGRAGTSVSGISGNVANSLAQGQFSAVAGKTNYIDGLYFTYSGATAASVVQCTVTGLVGGTFTFIVAVPAGVAVQGETKNITFPNGGMPASAVNTAIIAGCPALGAGNTNASMYLWGHQY